MEESILTKQQLSLYFGKCKESLNSGNAAPLTELATLMQTIAMVTDDDVFLTLPQSLGAYATELMRFKTLVSVPLLGPEQRNNCQECMNAAVSEGMNGLDILKKELCESSERNYCNILKAMAKFSKHGYLMYSLRNQFVAVPASRALPEE